MTDRHPSESATALGLVLLWSAGVISGAAAVLLVNWLIL